MVWAEPLEVVSECDEAELGGCFIDSSKTEPSEPFVLFQVSEYHFDLPSLFSLLDPYVAVQQFSDSLFEAEEVGRSLDDAVAASFMARATHGTAGAVPGLVSTVCLQIAGLCSARLLTDVSHRLTHRAGVSVGLLVILEFVRVERV